MFDEPICKILLAELWLIFFVCPLGTASGGHHAFKTQSWEERLNDVKPGLAEELQHKQTHIASLLRQEVPERLPERAAKGWFVWLSKLRYHIEKQRDIHMGRGLQAAQAHTLSAAQFLVGYAFDSGSLQW